MDNGVDTHMLTRGLWERQIMLRHTNEKKKLIEKIILRMLLKWIWLLLLSGSQIMTY